MWRPRERTVLPVNDDRPVSDLLPDDLAVRAP